jgi:hypothetical protein
MRRALARFWQKEESLSLLLALLVAFAFVLPPLAPAEDRRGLLTAALFSLVLVAGAATVAREKPWAVRAVAAVCCLALLLRWAAWLEPAGRFATWGAATETVALAVLALVVLAMVLRPGNVTRYRIEGAIAAYLLLGLAWASAFEWIALRDSSAFSVAAAVGGGSQQWSYYSFVTLTTMGYGDITPVHPLARSLATAEALTGQLYLAILISRLVALEIQSRGAE